MISKTSIFITGQMIYDYTKSSIVKVTRNQVFFFKELIKASKKTLLPYEKENLINWLFYFTADKPEIQKWFYEQLDKKNICKL